MNNADVTRNIWRNSISNYVAVFLRMGLGLFMFRMLYQGLTSEEFGFWALLWSVFGYGILLDFGFGFTAVKRVAELSVHEEWEKLSRVLSTIFFLYVALGLAIIVTVLFFSHSLIDLFKIMPENRENFRQILIIFFCGMGIAFPLGIFPEILHGQQRILTANVNFACGLIANFICLTLAFHYHLGLKYIVLLSLICGIAPCVASGIAALRSLPRVKIHPRFFSFEMIRETLTFSVFAYISTVSNMILGKTDQIVISTALAVSAVTIYQAGAKVGEMFGSFTQQLPETFSPAAAHLHARGDREFLRQLLVNGTRFSVMLATPVYLICAFYMEGILKIITGARALPVETFWIGEVLLFWQYTTLVTQSVTKRIFMMTGHERRLMWLGVGEATLNLALSIGLVLYYRNVLCVAFGSLIATFVFGWFYVWPWAAHEVRLSTWQLARAVLLPTWTACLPVLAFVLMGRFLPWFDFRSSTAMFLAESSIAMIIAAAGLWRYALTLPEREKLSLKFGKLFATFTNLKFV